MNIKHYNALDLKAWLSDPQFDQLPVKCISRNRIISQINNPWCSDSDILLVVAYDDHQNVLAYAGMLPDVNINGDKFAWNSNWYSVNGDGNTAVRVLLEAVINYKMVVFHDLTAKTLSIMANFKRHFSFHAVFGMQFYISPIPAKLLRIPLVSMLNSYWLRLSGLVIREKPEYSVINDIQEARVVQFLEKHHGSLFFRNPKSWPWIFKFPWLTATFEKGYAFSSQGNVSYHLIALTSDNSITALAWISVCNGNARLSYFIAPDNLKMNLSIAVSHFLKSLSISSVLFFHPYMVINYPKIKRFFFWGRQRVKNMAFTANTSIELSLIQDGDGDIIFT